MQALFDAKVWALPQMQPAKPQIPQISKLQQQSAADHRPSSTGGVRAPERARTRGRHGDRGKP